MKTFSAISSAVMLVVGYMLCMFVLAGVAGLPGFETAFIQTSADGAKSLNPLGVFDLIFGATLTINANLQQPKKD